MTAYLADTNVFLRLFLHDNKKQAKIVEKYFLDAKRGKIEIVIPSEIIPEIEYALRKYYGVPRSEIGEKLTYIMKIDYLKIEKRAEWLDAIKYYINYIVDPVDALIFVQAQKNNQIIFSFDHDYKKMKSN